jgi:hypothetical protein
LWSGYPNARRLPSRAAFVFGFLLATIAAFFVVFLEPSPWHAAGQFVHRTFGYQLGRDSPFSIWDWRQYHARGLPNLHIVQTVLTGVVVAGAAALGWWPRRRSPLQLAAFTGVLLIGFELVLTHFSYLYIPWFFPFVAIALLSGPGRAPARSS